MYQILVCINRKYFRQGVPLAIEAGIGLELQTFTYQGELAGDWRGELAAEKQALQEHAGPLTMHCMMLDTHWEGMADAAAEYARVYRTNVDIAAELGAKVLVVHPFCHRIAKPHRYDRTKQYRSRQVSFFGEFVACAEKAGVELVLENLCETEPRVLAEVIEEIDSPFLNACLDVGHANIYGEVPLPAWVERLGPRLRYLHLHDNYGKEDQHLPIGEGTADFPALLKALDESKFRPWLSVEVRDKPAAMRSVEYLMGKWRSTS